MTPFDFVRLVKKSFDLDDVYYDFNMKLGVYIYMRKKDTTMRMRYHAETGVIHNFKIFFVGTDSKLDDAVFYQHANALSFFESKISLDKS